MAVSWAERDDAEEAAWSANRLWTQLARSFTRMSRRVGLLREKPRPATSRLLALSKMAFSILHGGVIAAALILIYQIAVADGKAEDITRAAIFIGLIPGNKLIFYPLAITACLTLLIFLIPAVSELFRLSMPDTERVLFSIGSGMASVLWFEIFKLLMGTPRKTATPIAS